MSKGRRDEGGTPATPGPADRERREAMLADLAQTSALTLVLHLNRATGQLSVVPVGVNLPAETVLGMLDQARTTVVRAMVAAEQQRQQQAAPGDPAGAATNG